MANISLRRHARVAILAIGVLSSSTLSGCGNSSADSNDAEKGTVVEEVSVALPVRPVEKRSLGQTVSALGRCEALPQRLAIVTPVIEGQVTKILVNQGEEVAAGRAIVQLDTTLAQADLLEKQAARNSLEASLRSLESLPREEEKRTSQLAIEQADIAVRRAQALVERLQPLHERKEIPDAQVFEADEALKQAQVQKQTAQAQFELLMLRPRTELLAEAQSKIKVADEAVKTAKTRLDLHTIRAPISGVLDSLTCRPGQTIPVGASIGEIIDNREVLAIAWLPVGRSRMIRVGQKASVHVSAPSSASTKSIEETQGTEGSVAYVGRSADAQSGNVPLHVLVDNTTGELVIGQTLYVDVFVEEPVPKLCVPLSAVHDEGDGAAVTVVRDGKAVVLHPQLGAIDAGWIEVSDTDLKEGEPVAVAGAYNLPDGTPVKVEMVTSEPGSVR